MKASAIQHLVCPETLGPLRLTAVEVSGDEILEGTLVGESATYAIHGGIPGFVPVEVLQTQTVRSFTQKWAKHHYYREHTGKFYTDWYLQRYGFFELSKLREFLRGKAFILDAGTGAGRDAANFAEHSSATVFGVDTAREALEVARREVDHPRVEFVQADVTSLPFPDEFFDFINCDQVIHHTPDPRATFEHLRRKLKPGGQICCYVYKKKAVIREFTDDYVRKQLSRLPIDEALKVCEGITRLGRTLAGLRASIEIEEDIPVLGIKKGKLDLQRFLHWNVMKCFWNDEFDFFTNNIINFDWYHPEYCFRSEPGEFRSWFAEGWEIQAWDVQDAGISCRAGKV
ncbi:MAG: class I SAM-dependent methyltransferase [Phycisphaerae bacterium]